MSETLFAPYKISEQRIWADDRIRRGREKLPFDFLKKFRVPAQYFNIPPMRKSVIKGKLGTVIAIDSRKLTYANGIIPTQSIRIELQELQDQQSLARNNAPTVSGGRLLESGGAYYLNATSDEGQLYIADSDAVSVQFRRISERQMDLFEGQASPIGVADWSDPQPILSSDSDKLYAPVALEKFGWYNCDRFYEEEKETEHTLVSYDLQGEVPIREAMVFLIFKDFNAVVSSLYSQNSNAHERLLSRFFQMRSSARSSNWRAEYARLMGSLSPNSFRSMPLGRRVQFLATTSHQGEIFACLSEPVDLTRNHQQKLQLCPVSTYEYDQLLSSI